jgi:hypothetical protein
MGLLVGGRAVALLYIVLLLLLLLLLVDVLCGLLCHEGTQQLQLWPAA